MSMAPARVEIGKGPQISTAGRIRFKSYINSQLSAIILLIHKEHQGW